jgi:hypothetical protein
VQKIQIGNLDGLAGLAGLADHTGLDIRPTLLRVLTDLYVQKPSHGVEEERHYVELALRLIDVVDAGTCAAVATSLAAYPNAPAEVVQRLAPIAALGYPRPSASARNASSADPAPDNDEFDIFEPDASEADPFEPDIFESDIFEPKVMPAATPQPLPATAAPAFAAPQPADFIELREIFFDADPQTRRLILMNLDIVAARQAPALASGTSIMRYLEQAAIAGRRQEFITLLQQSLRISRALTTRIVADTSGEPFVVAGRALAMPSEVFQRILMFLNPETGQSVQKVYDLADLFLDLPQDSALHLLSVWRSADRAEARAAIHRPAHWPDNAKAPRATGTQEAPRKTGVQASPTQRRA